ncbi:glycosyltransferase family 2 protein [Dechloromonas sp. A34]|uniref:glycosyltransferase family 2 protein n=1 Tax=Dechloromonas sp. A34 TaxID=447588 RepID=UPI0022498C76|nr:glycosyltransferase family 2 protein [Dechloromonas sp. A34]
MTDRFSVALATCNGATYLAEFLDSLAVQQLPPCELVVSDDASTDATLAILERFASDAAFEVRILRNTTRLGVVNNFARSIAACCGEVIALADQDDVWHPHKLTRLAQALLSPETQAAFSDAAVVDADLASLGYTMWHRVRFTQDEQACMARGEGFTVLLKHSVVTGAALAFRSSLRDVALPVPEDWAHDAWLANIAAARGAIIPVPELLLAYRQHDSNVVGGRARPLLYEIRAALKTDRAAWYRTELQRWEALNARLASTNPAASMRSSLAEKIRHLQSRADLPVARWRRVPLVLNEVLTGRYARYARNWGSIAIDLLVK